jgi:hypothetical protein
MWAMSPQAGATPPVTYGYYPIAASGCATSLSPWKNGDTWMTGCGSSGDNMVYEIVRNGSAPEEIQSRNLYAKQVAVDPSSIAAAPTVWAINTAGVMYQYVGSQKWSQYSLAPACTRSIAIGAADTFWIIRCDNTVAHKFGATFITDGTGPVPLAKVVVPQGGGNPWFLAQSGDIYTWNGGFRKVSGCATSMGIGYDGLPWITACSSNAYGNVYRGTSGGGFTQVVWSQKLNLKSISVSYENIPWGIGDGTTYPLGTIIERTAELNFKAANVPQMENMWCWAASGESVYNYLNGEYAGPQCRFVGEVLGRSDCCNTCPSPCNTSGRPETVFDHFGIKYTRVPNTPKSWEGLASNFSSGSPVVVFYQPTTGVGHVEVGEGMWAYDGVQYVERWNPDPVGVGTWETVTYANFANPWTGWYSGYTYDRIYR